MYSVVLDVVLCYPVSTVCTLTFLVKEQFIGNCVVDDTILSLEVFTFFPVVL
jgi:hypothetical protein